MKSAILILLFVMLAPLSGRAGTVWLGGKDDPWAWRPWKAAGSVTCDERGLVFDARSNRSEKEAVAIWDVPDVQAARIRFRLHTEERKSASALRVRVSFKDTAGEITVAPATLVASESMNGGSLFEARYTLPVGSKPPLLKTIFIQVGEADDRTPFSGLLILSYAELLN
jgi:hypothetical protein